MTVFLNCYLNYLILDTSNFRLFLELLRDCILMRITKGLNETKPTINK